MRRRLLCIFIIKQLINYSIQRDYIITIFLPVALFCYFSYKPNFPFHSNVFLNAAPKTRGRVFQSKKKKKKKKQKNKKQLFISCPSETSSPSFWSFPPPPYIHNKHLKLERWRNIIYNNFIFSPSHALRNWWAVSRNRLPSPSTLPFLFLFCCRRRILLCIPEASNPSVCAALLLYSYVIL